MTAVTSFSAPTTIERSELKPAIRFEHVSKSYPSTAASAAVTALDDVSLAIAPGTVFGVIGRSGAGKSTLIRAINGLERVSAGRVIVDGTDVASLAEPGLRQLRRRIGMVFQHFNLLASRTAFDNIALPLELAGVERRKIRRRVDDLLGLVGLADKANRYPAELSGGQKQRVGIARALATEPKVLLSDEATSALDPETTEQILALLRHVNEVTGVTIVLITHEMQVIKAICDRVAVIEQGRIIEEGATYEVLARPRTETTRNFVASVAGSALPEGLERRLVGHPTLAHHAVLRIVFTGEHATAPILSRLSRTLDIDVNILAGKVDRIGRAPFGNLLVSLPAREDVVGAAVGLIRAHGLDAEVLGYVA